jgi:hypothetical protein
MFRIRGVVQDAERGQHGKQSVHKMLEGLLGDAQGVVQA